MSIEHDSPAMIISDECVAVRWYTFVSRVYRIPDMDHDRYYGDSSRALTPSCTSYTKTGLSFA